MREYKCFQCGALIKPEQIKKKIICARCGSKIFYKTRNITKMVKAI